MYLKYGYSKYALDYDLEVSCFWKESENIFKRDTSEKRSAFSWMVVTRIISNRNYSIWEVKVQWRETLASTTNARISWQLARHPNVT
jgi:hypothetical protein